MAGDNFSDLISVHSASIALLAEAEIQILAVEAHPVTNPFSQTLFEVTRSLAAGGTRVHEKLVLFVIESLRQASKVMTDVLPGSTCTLNKAVSTGLSQSHFLLLNLVQERVLT